MAEIADLYIGLRAVTAPAVEGMAQVGVAGEQMALKIDTALKGIDTAVKGLGVEMQAAATRMAATANEMALANERLAASFAPVAAGAKTTAAEVGASEEGMAAKTKASTTEMAAAERAFWAEHKALTAQGIASNEAYYVHREAMAAKTAALTTGQIAMEGKAVAATEKVGAAGAAAADASVLAGTKMSGAYKMIGLGAIAAGLEAIHMAGNFQASTDVFTTTAGEDIRNMDMIRQGMLQLSTDTGTDAEKMVAAMYKVESSHIHGAAALKVLTAAAQGAKIENADLTKTADALTTTMTDFHFPVEQAATVMSKLVAVAGSGKLTMEEMAGSLHSVELVASQSGLSIEQVGGALATMTMHGMSADQATQNLRNAIQNLEAPNHVAVTEMAALGVNALDVSDKLGQRGLSGTYKVLTDAIASHVQGGHVVLELFNNSAVAAEKAQRALTGLPPELQKVGQAFLDGKGSMADFTKMAKTLGDNISGERAKEFETLANRAHGFSDALKNGQPDVTNFVDAFKRMTGGTVGLGVALGLTGENAAAFDQSVTAIAQATPQADGAVKGWEETQSRFNTQMDRAKESIKNTGIMIGTVLLPIVTPIVGAIANFTDKLLQNQGVAHALAYILGGVLALAFAGLALKGIKAITSLALELPKDLAKMAAWALRKIGIMKTVEVATEVSATAEAAADERGWARRMMIAIGNGARWLGVKAATAMGAVLIAVDSALREGAAWAAGELRKLATATANGARWLGVKAAIAMGAVLIAVADGAKEAAAWAAAEAKKLLEATTKGAAWLAVKVAQGVAAAASAVAQGAAVAAAWAVAEAKVLADAVAKGAVWVATKIAQGVAVMVSNIASAAATAAAWVAANIAMIIASGGIILIIGLVIAAGIFLITHWQQVKQVAGQVWDWIKQKFTEGKDWCVAKFQGLIDFFKNAGQWLLDAGKRIMDGFLAGLKAAWEGVKNFVGGIGQWIADHKGPVAVDAVLLTPHGQAIIGGLQTGMVTQQTQVQTYLQQFPNTSILPAFANSPTLLTKTGQSMMAGLKQGLDTGAATVTTDIQQFATNLLNTINTAFGTAAGGGASTKLQQIGAALMTGLKAGLDSQEQVVIADIIAFDTRLLQTLNTAFGMGSATAPSTVFTQYGVALMTGLKTGLDQQEPTVLQDVQQWCQKLIQATNQAFGISGGRSQIFYQMGIALMDGLAAGITAGGAKAVAAATAVARQVAAASKASLRVTSPSRLFFEIGQFLVEGLALGIEAHTERAVNAAKMLAHHVHHAMKGAAATATLTAVADFSGAGRFNGVFDPNAPIATVAPAAAPAGAGASGGDTHLTVHVHGSMWTTKDLVKELQRELLRHGIRNTSNATNYSFG